MWLQKGNVPLKRGTIPWEYAQALYAFHTAQNLRAEGYKGHAPEDSPKKTAAWPVWASLQRRSEVLTQEHKTISAAPQTDTSHSSSYTKFLLWLVLHSCCHWSCTCAVLNVALLWGLYWRRWEKWGPSDAWNWKFCSVLSERMHETENACVEIRGWGKRCTRVTRKNVLSQSIRSQNDSVADHWLNLTLSQPGYCGPSWSAQIPSYPVRSHFNHPILPSLVVDNWCTNEVANHVGCKHMVGSILFISWLPVHLICGIANQNQMQQLLQTSPFPSPTQFMKDQLEWPLLKHSNTYDIYDFKELLETSRKGRNLME